jgi:hypothetical protein
VSGVVSAIESDKPTLTVQFSREYAERLEAATILHILKSIVGQFTGHIDAPQRAAA